MLKEKSGKKILDIALKRCIIERIRNRNPVIPHLAASSCIGAMTFSSVAREIKATPHPMETIAIRNMIIVMF